jgi:hypothetical protein
VSSASARHAEIARRYEKGERAPFNMAAKRVKELHRLFTARYGRTLPDDDAGRDDAMIMAHHLAYRPDAERYITNWLGLWAPWMTRDEARTTTAKVLAKPLRWRADKLGIRLRLTEAERHRLGITTIGSIEVTKEERLKRRQARKRQRKELLRRAQGARQRSEYEANSVNRNKPWLALRMSRASWYRAGKPTA